MKARGITTRLAAGVYDYLINGRLFRLENVQHDAGLKRPLWHVSEIKAGRKGEAFEGADTLTEAKRWAEIAAGPEVGPEVAEKKKAADKEYWSSPRSEGKPLIDIL